MNIQKNTLRRILLVLSAPLLLSSCIDDKDDDVADSIPIAFINKLPEGVPSIKSAVITMTELNTGSVYRIDPFAEELGSVPLGIYDYEGTIRFDSHDEETGTSVEKTLRVAGTSVTISSPISLHLEWFFSNPGGTLIFSEIYATGSPNATATGGIRDSYFKIYNNTDQTIYADGLGIVESALVNAKASTYEILTEANDRQKNFTAATIWVIPGSGTDFPIEPGKSLKIVDQAIDWSTQVSGAFDHRDADFEWYDDNAQDTDSPSVPNLSKWYCYSNTIWIMSNQCNRSYALVKFPDGMTSEEYLSQYHGGYDYISTIGTQMHNDRAYLIPNSWIIDGVNLGNSEAYIYGALGNNIDISYACISDRNSDPNRFGRIFRRKVATTTSDDRVIFQDTNDSKADFIVISSQTD